MIDLNKTILLDGAFGTELQKKILPAAAVPEEYNVLAPEAVRSIHRSYVEAGSQILYANTFGCSPVRLDPLGLSCEELLEAAVALARDAAKGTDVKVALDLGPSGMMMEPMGPLRFEQAYAGFARMVEAGVRAGADLIVIETMTDLYEVKAALLAAKEHSSLPVFVSMTFEDNGRTFAGVSVEAMVCLAEAFKADAVGINCSLGPEQLAPLLERVRSLSDLPVLAKPNAGLPDPRDGSYHLSDEEFVRAASEFVQKGVRIVGGCCGTTPSTIRALAEALATQNTADPVRKTDHRSSAGSLCSPTRTVSLDSIRVVGERINPTGKKRLQQALLDQDYGYLARLALEQQEAGADILDVNVGYPGVDEVDVLPKAVRAIQSVCDLPLLLDSSNPEALEAGLRAVNGVAAINSVNGKQESMDAILPLAARYGSPVVALCLDEDGIPETSEKRLEIAARIRDEAARYGIGLNRLWFDCLSLTVSAQQSQAAQTLRAIEVIARDWKAPTILGVTNISFGLPQRTIMNRTFLNAALQAGLRFAIINPSVSDLMDTVRAFKVLNGEDEGCRDYTERYSQQPETEKKKKAETSVMSLYDSIVRGLEQEAARLTKAELDAGRDELSLAQEELIPALDQVGTDFEQGKLYLPSLLQAAAAAQAAFEVIRDALASHGKKQATKGTVVLATVQGDVHDIGKNIVRTLLENYGYAVLDLGKDVDPQIVLDTVRENGIQLVGLSALMTTTLPAMEKTISLLHTLENPPKIMVGGAVVTQEAADQMGADCYAEDARASVRFADEVFSE